MTMRKVARTISPTACWQAVILPAQLWGVIGAALIVSAGSDILIMMAEAAGYSMLRPWIISIFSAGNLLVIGLASFSPHLRVEAADALDEAPSSAEPDQKVWEAVQAFMMDRKPYLDPDLTLTRLSRKLSIPAKTLSLTINRATGGNVSRYINEARIKAAQQALREGETVTQAMLSCGFNTKSNFNREFRRVAGQSPSAWVSSHLASSDHVEEEQGA